MEVLASVVGSLVAEPCRALFLFLRDKLRNPLRFTANLVALDKEMEGLIDRRNQLREHLALAATAGLQAPPQVRNWLGQVNRLEGHVRCFKDYLALRARKSACSSCLSCSKLADRVARWLQEARKLTSDAGEFPESMAGPDSSIVRTEYIPAPTIVDQPTASRNMAKVMDVLSSMEVKRIGIWDSELKKVQKLIADRLKLALTEESMETRASKLHARLMMEKTFLLILDDVWDTMDLDLVGIPAPDVHKGGKIILTTRFSNVCLQMTEVTLKIDVLNEKEAWSLFCTSAGEVATLGEVEPLARAITKECAGLPLAIVVVGASLRGKRMIELWKDALNALRRSEPLIRVGLRIKFTILSSGVMTYCRTNAKSCFLFCCLFPEDYQIHVEELVRYWLAEGLLDEYHNIEEVVDRGMTIIEILKDSSLLEQGDWSTVKIHDVFRDVSVWISSSLQKECKFLVRSGIGLHQIREGELFGKSYKRVSFMNNEIKELPNAVPECPTVSTLLLQWNKELEEIPHQFLAAFMSLKILDLSGCFLIKSLPPCFDQLGELQALVLRSCIHLETLPPFGGLAKLQVLVCSNTKVATLPQGMEKLTSLRILDLSYNQKLTVIPTGLMSDSSASTLETSDTLLNRMMKFKKFELFIGSSASILEADRGRSKKGCQGLDIMLEKLVANSDEVGSYDTVKLLSISTSTDGAEYLISLGSTIVSLVKLERILVYSCEQAEELFKFDQNSAQDSMLFPNLKAILLSDCPALRYLSEQNVACPGLEVVSVQNCPLLRKLPFTAQNVGTIKQIIGKQEWWDELEWENDDIKNNLQPCFYAYVTQRLLSEEDF
ncbi:UNVERIFIED_CONTAM: Disease resistance protein [Sesamum angustifolium]|uniref:Disease resistance protein n=1 Tax=Sesamum angustifolium TaxID=2727405 RepID=A0AAW2RHF4_9LAMI